MKNLRKMRKAFNQSQEYVAEKIGVSKSTYSKYESGKIPMSSNKLIQLVYHFDVSADFLLGIATFPIKASHLEGVFGIYDDYMFTKMESEEMDDDNEGYSPHQIISAEESLDRLINASQMMTEQIEYLKERLYGNEVDGKKDSEKE